MAGLKESIGGRVLRKRKKRFNRQVLVHNFESANSAVILFDTSEQDAGTVIRGFMKYLKSQGIDCKAYGLAKQKEIPQDMLFWKEFSFITRSDTSWYLKPKGEVSEAYFAEKPDILFDFSRFFVELSQASFKVGCFTEADNDYDLMINLGEQYDLAYLAEQFRHYISILNPVNQ